MVLPCPGLSSTRRHDHPGRVPGPLSVDNRAVAGACRQPACAYLFPLDTIRDWNRLYGPAGFYQYQCVVPREAGSAAIREMLEAIARSGDGSVLAVLKTFGDRWPLGLLSFARPGVTLALDFQNRAGVEILFERLDAIVTAAGGRLYPAKDARMPRSMFEAGMSSAMSRRLMGS